MKDFKSDEWIPRIRYGKVVYDRKELDRPLPTMEENILDCFAEQYVFKDALKFKQVEKEFLDSLTPAQKEQYFKVFEMLQAYCNERKKKLVSYVRNWGRIAFD